MYFNRAFFQAPFNFIVAAMQGIFCFLLVEVGLVGFKGLCEKR